MIDDVGTSTLIRWIVALPLAAAAVQALTLFFARKAVRRFWVASLTIAPLVLSFLFLVGAFVELVGLPREERLLRDFLWSWIGVGVGDATFGAELVFRFDALSAALGIVYLPIALAVLGYALASMHSDNRGDGGYQRFFVFSGLSFSAVLVFLFADNPILLLGGWMGSGLGTAWLVGFWYSEEGARRVATRSVMASLASDALLLLSFVILFWSLTERGLHPLDLDAIRASMPALGREQLALPFGYEVRTLAVVAILMALSAAARAGQFPMTMTVSGVARAPAPASALGLMNASLGVVLCCRLDFVLAASPMTSNFVVWIGAITCVAGAAIALAQRDLIKILVAAAVSQFGVAFIAVGCGIYSAAIFQVVMALIVFSLLVLCAGSVINTLDGERDIRRLGGLNVRLILTHLMALIGVFSPALFLAREQATAVLMETDAIPGAGFLYALALIGTGLVSWAISRFLIDVFWGSIRTPLGFRGEFNDPGLGYMIPLYGLAFVSILGVAVNPAQIWGDLLPGGVEGSDSLTQFLAVIYGEAAGSTIEAADRWQGVLLSSFVTLVGFATTYLFFVRLPRVRMRLNRRLAPVQNVLAARGAGPRIERMVGTPLGALSHYWLELRAAARFGELQRRVANRALVASRYLMTGFRRAERGLPDVSLLLALIGLMLLLAAVLP